MTSVSTRHVAPDVAAAASASHVSMRYSLPANNAAAYQHATLLQRQTELPSVSNGEPISRSAVDSGKEDEVATEEPSSCSDADDKLGSETADTVSVSVCTDPLLLDSVNVPCKSDDELLTATCDVPVHQSDETVTRTAVKHDEDAVLHENSAQANVVDDSDLCNGNVKDTDQFQYAEPLSEVCHDDVSDSVCSRATGDAGFVSVGQSELSDSITNDENLLPVVESETADSELVQTVAGEDTITEARSSSVSELSVIDEQCCTHAVSEELDGTERVADVSDGGNCNETMEASLVSYVPEEPMLCAAAAADDNKVCMAGGETELLMSSGVVQPDEPSSTFSSSDVVRYEPDDDDDDGPEITRPADSSHHTECTQLVDSESLQTPDSCLSATDVCLAAPLSGDSSQVCTTDTHQLPADSASEETYLDATFDDQYEQVDFTIGESTIADSTFRRCSLDLGGRGQVLSRIAEESTAGLAAVAGDIEHSTESHQQDEEQSAASGECGIRCYLVILLFTWKIKGECNLEKYMA